MYAKATFSPNGNWIKQQLRQVLWVCDDQGLRVRFYLRDNGSCYSNDCDILLKAADIKTVRTPVQATNANSHAERFVLSIKKECLDYLLVFDINRLERIVDDYILYFNKYRPHKALAITYQVSIRNWLNHQDRHQLSNYLFAKLFEKNSLAVC